MKPKLLFRRNKGRFSASSLLTAAIGLSALGATAQAAEVTYQYYRFNPSVPAGTAVQLSEFTFSRGGVKLNVNNTTGVGPVVTVLASGGTTGAGEDGSKAVDGNLGSKWLSSTIAPLVFDFGSPVTIDSYNWATANDFRDRTPNGWTFQGSNDNDAWVDLDSRPPTQAPRFNGAFFTYQAGFSINPATAPLVNAVWTNSPAIVTAAAPLNLNVVTTRATGITINPGAITGAPTAVTQVTTAITVPAPVSGPYKVTATNTTTRTASATFGYKIVPTPDTLSYRYVRYTPIKLRGGTTTQLAEFEFYNAGTKVTVASVTNPGGANPANEGTPMLIDGITNVPGNKYLDFNKAPVVFDFGSVKTFDRYQFFTGGDFSDRSPVRWTLEGSNDGTAWTLLESVNEFDYPTTIAANTGIGQLPLYYRPLATLTWTGSVSALWDKVAANFSGPQTVFTDGTTVNFTDAGANKIVSAAAEIFPGAINVTNSTGNDYVFTGQIIAGASSLTKTGTGTLTLASPNAIKGDFSFSGGKVISAIQRGLGESDATGKLSLSGGTELVVAASHYSNRPLSIATATINVAAGQTFSSVGPMALAGTITKTGTGTLVFSAYNGSSTTVDTKLIISDGVVSLGSDSFNQTIFGGNYLKATVTSGGILRGTENSSFGGDQVDYQTGIGQFRFEEGGVWELNGGRQYLSAGFIKIDGVDQPKIILRGGTIRTNGQLENARHPVNADATNATRCIIATEGSATSSLITGAGTVTNNTSYTVFQVADGAAANDLVIETVVDGGYGIIKEGAGNLVLTRNNTYAGETPAGTWVMPQATTIRAGTLTVTNSPAVTGDSATGLTPVLLETGTTLAGTGTIAGTVQANGSISVGTATTQIGTLSLGNTTLVGTLFGQVDGEEREDDFGGIIRASDLLNIKGNLTITGATLNVTGIGDGATQPSYTIVKYTGDLTGTFATPTVPSGYTVVYDNALKEIRIESSGTPPPTGFTAWATAAGLTGADAGPTADPDSDGLTNLIEFVVGGSPTVSSQANAPTMVRNSNGDFVFTFRRTTDSASLNPGVEYSTGLTGTWTAAPAGNVNVEAGGFGTGVDKVTVTLPSTLSASGKLFARLKAVL